MDEQRSQAYLSLIQELRECPSGEEPQILDGHLELVDEGFVQVCELVAAQLQEAGQDNQAQFLRNVAQEVGQYLNSQLPKDWDQNYKNPHGSYSNDFPKTLYEAIAVSDNFSDPEKEEWYEWLKTATSEQQEELMNILYSIWQENIQSFMGIGKPIEITNNSKYQGYFDFLIELLKVIFTTNGGNTLLVNTIMQNNVKKLNCNFSTVLQYWAKKALNEVEEKEAIKIAATIGELASFTEQFSSGVRADNIEIAIVGYKISLTIFTQKMSPQLWAKLQVSLGGTYRNRIQGDQEQNLEWAINYYKAALEVYTQEAFPEQWAKTQNNLGITYGKRILGEAANNIEQEIYSYESALQIYTPDKFPEDYALTQYFLGKSYEQRILGDKANNIEQEIYSYESALQIYTPDKFPEDYAFIQYSLGKAYAQRIRGEKLDNIEQQIAAYESALQVLNIEKYPKMWETAQMQLGNAYCKRIYGNGTENIDKMISCYEKVLKLYTPEQFSILYREAKFYLEFSYNLRFLVDILESMQNSKGDYSNVNAKLKNHSCILNEPFVYCLQTWANLKFKELDEHQSVELAGIITIFGNLVYDLPYGNPSANIEIAITSYEIVLPIYNKVLFPDGWLVIQRNLGIAYCHRIKGDKANNIEKAITFYNTALEACSPTFFPEHWAFTQNGLGNTYIERIFGNKAENIEQAIFYHKAALEVFSPQAFPEEWAMIQNNLGIAYSHRIDGDKTKNTKQSLSYYEAALKVYFYETYPEKWAMIQNNIGVIYQKAGNIIESIASIKKALKIYTYQDFPLDWAMAQHNLGNAYLDSMQKEQNQYIDKGIAAYQAALQVYDRDKSPQIYTETLLRLGSAYQIKSRFYTNEFLKKQTALQNAYDTFEEALDTVEYLRGEITSGDEAKRKLNEEWNKLYRGMVEVCLELGRYTDAIEYADRSKARNLTELIATRDAYPGGEIPPEDRQRLQELRQAISEEDRRLKQDSNPDYTHINQLREEFQAKYPYKPLKFSDIQSLLDDETAILEWYILGDNFLTFILTNQTLNLWTSSEQDRKNLIDWTVVYIAGYCIQNTQWKDNLPQWRDNLPQSLETLAQILHLDEILANLRKNFPNCKKLILIPHRFLHLFPLHALPVATGEGEGQLLQDLFP
ncbi:MAG: CHAT domain-containing protein, partial [Planktothrix sp.]